MYNVHNYAMSSAELHRAQRIDIARVFVGGLLRHVQPNFRRPAGASQTTEMEHFIRERNSGGKIHGEKTRGDHRSPIVDQEPIPPDLGQNGLRLWTRVQSEYRVSDVGGVELLTQACRALDRAEKCRIQIDAEGETIMTKGGLRDHPLLKHELHARSFVARTLSRLGIDSEPVRSRPGRPGMWSG